MLKIKEFCVSKGSHSKNLVNQPTLTDMSLKALTPLFPIYVLADILFAF